MTLLVAAACRNFVVLAADRRLIWERGMPYEEFTKAGVLLCEDGRMAYGLASDLAAYGAPGGAPAFPSRTGEFNAGEWAVKNLVEASDGDKRIRPTLETFTERATREWQKWPVPSRTKRTEFMFAGLEYEIDESSADADGEPKHAIARPTVATVTNISSDGKRSEPEFRLELERPGTHYMVLGGNHWAFRRTHENTRWKRYRNAVSTRSFPDAYT